MIKRNVCNLIVYIVFAMLLSATQTSAQGFKIGDPQAGKTFTGPRFGTDQYQFLREAEILYRKFDLEGAFFAYENAVINNPRSAEALVRRARFKKLFGMESEALEDIALAERINPYAADLFAYHGPYSILNVIEYEPAGAAVSLPLNKRVGEYYEWLDNGYKNREVDESEMVLLEDALIEMELGNWSNAQYILDGLLSLSPQSAVAWDLKGLVYAHQGQYDAAKAAYEEALKQEPDFAIAWYNLSRLERENGQLSLAKQHLDKAIQLEEDLIKAYFDRALVHKAMGQPEAALDNYNKVLAMDGEHYLEAYLNRGLTRKMMGDFNGALADFNQAVRDFPEHAELYKNRGNLYLIFGEHNKAIEDYTRAIELDEAFAEAYYNRGLAHFIIYDYVSGCADLQQSVDLGFDRALEKQQYFCVE